MHVRAPLTTARHISSSCISPHGMVRIDGDSKRTERPRWDGSRDASTYSGSISTKTTNVVPRVDKINQSSISISNPNHFLQNHSSLIVIIVNVIAPHAELNVDRLSLAWKRVALTISDSLSFSHRATSPNSRPSQISVRPILSPRRRCDAHACPSGTRRRSSFGLLRAPIRSDISTTRRQARLIWSTRFTVHHVKFLPVCSLNCRLFRTHVGCLFLATCHRYLYLNRKYYYVG